MARLPEADPSPPTARPLGWSVSHSQSGETGVSCSSVSPRGVFLPSSHVVLDEQLSEAEMAIYEGVYELGPDFELAVYSRDGQLFTQATGQVEIRFRAQGDHIFIPTFDDEVRLVFVVENGKATTAVLQQGGQVREAPRIR